MSQEVAGQGFKEEFGLGLRCAAFLGGAILLAWSSLMACAGGSHHKERSRNNQCWYQYPQERLLFHNLWNVWRS